MDHAPSRETPDRSKLLLSGAAIAATTTTFCKQFVPFYHLHSTIIFVVAAFVSSLLIVPVWKLRPEPFMKARSAVIVMIGIWSCAALSYVLFARHGVPPTYLAGFFLFSGFFMLLGVVASGSPRSVAVVFAVIAVIYLYYLARYVAHFGFLYPSQRLIDRYNFPIGFGDIFDLSSHPEADSIDLYLTLYQNVGRFLALGGLSALMLVRDKWRQRKLVWILIFATFALLLWIGARGSILGLAAAICLSVFVNRRSPVKNLLLIFATALLVGALLVLVKAEFGISIPVVDRTIAEIQDPNPRMRGPLLAHLLTTLEHEPHSMLLGRGLGMFPVELGQPAPDWLIARSVAVYPHNIILEALYEIGIGGTAFLILLLIIPIRKAHAILASLSRTELFIFQLYVYHLASLMVSGALAYSYDFYFVLGLTVGALHERTDDTGKRLPS